MNREDIESFYKQRFKCVHLDDYGINSKEVRCFDGGNKGIGIVKYLKGKAYEEEHTGGSRGYFLVDVELNEIVAYFSIKCGLLYTPYNEGVKLEDRDFLEMLVDAVADNNEKQISEYKASGIYSDAVFADYLDRAHVIVDAQKNNTLNASETFSAIEVENLCKNEAYSGQMPRHVGFFVFWLYIVPKVIEVSNLVGCKYVYLFAADRTSRSYNDSEKYKLINYYKKYFKFHDMMGLKVIKPEYDFHCFEMMQSLKELENNSEGIWEEFSDFCIS